MAEIVARAKISFVIFCTLVGLIRCATLPNPNADIDLHQSSEETSEVNACGRNPKCAQEKQRCDAGDLKGCSELGEFEYSIGNFIEAQKFLKQACYGKEMRGCVDLGGIASEQGNKTEARLYYKRACDGSEMQGCNNLARLAFEEGNRNEASRLLKKSCLGGNMRGCVGFGALENERGNRGKAKRLYVQACNAGEMQGCMALDALEIQGSKFKERSNQGVAMYLTPRSGFKLDKETLYFMKALRIVQKTNGGYLITPNQVGGQPFYIEFGAAFLKTSQEFNPATLLFGWVYYVGDYQYISLNGFSQKVPMFRPYVGKPQAERFPTKEY